MKEFIKKAKKASGRGDYSQAGDFYYLAGDMDNALKMYLKGNHYDLAAKLYEKMEELEEAAEYYRKAKDFLSAADCYHRLKKFKEASTMYQLGKDYYKAAEMSQKAGDFLRAAQMLERTSYQDKAAFLYIRVGDNLKAAQIMEKLYLAYRERDKPHKDLSPQEDERLADYCRLCAEQYFKAGNYPKAGFYYEELALYEKAAKAYNRAGQPEKEMECLIKEGKYADALKAINQYPSLKIEPTMLGDLYKGSGEYLKAAKSFLEADEKDKAAECFHLAGNNQQAAAVWEELKNFFQAAKLYLKAGNWQKAALMYEKEGELSSAAQLYYKGKESSKAAELYLKAEEYLKAADIYYELKDVDNYIRALQRVPDVSPDYRRACFLLGKAFVEKELYSLAEKAFLKSIKGMEINEENKEYYYFLGLLYEKLNNPAKSKEMFEKILSLDYKYKDVAQRIEKLKKLTAKLLEEEIVKTQPLKQQLVSSIKTVPGLIIANRYKIKKEIGEGGMSRVFLVHDMKLDELIALKLLIPYLLGDEEQLKRFIQEIKLSRKINHPNVIRVFDLGEWQENQFITMEYIDGGNLQDWMENNPGDMKMRIDFVLQICSGLNAAHRLAIVHRDIKPQNILIDKGKVAKIVDFGISRSLGIGTRTLDGKIIGTPEYMSPEQIEGFKTDQRSDIYSFGILMYQLFSGQLPFSAQNLGQILLKHLREKPVPTTTINPRIPLWMESIILKAMEKDPSRRYQNTEEILKEVKANWKRKADSIY